MNLNNTLVVYKTLHHQHNATRMIMTMSQAINLVLLFGYKLWGRKRTRCCFNNVLKRIWEDCLIRRPVYGEN